MQEMTIALAFLAGWVIGTAVAWVLCRYNHLRETNEYVTVIHIMENEMQAMDERMREMNNDHRKN